MDIQLWELSGKGEPSADPQAITLCELTEGVGALDNQERSRTAAIAT